MSNDGLLVSSLDVPAATEESMVATEYVFNLYRSIFELLHSDHLLFSIRYLLMGFKQCVEQGPNPDDVPNYQKHVEDTYYEWASWKETTLSLNKRKICKSRFRFEAMMEYIQEAHRYLKKIIPKDEMLKLSTTIYSTISEEQIKTE